MYALAPHQLMMIIINCVALLLGAPGNILILRIYFSKPRKTSTHILIMGLALSDLVSLCMTFPLEIVSWGDEHEMTGRTNFCRLVGFFYHYFAQCSVLITVAIAIDRYNAVCRPHQWKITTARAQGVVATCLLLGTLTSTMALFSYDVKTIEIDANLVYFEADTPMVNVSFCSRDVEGAFDKTALIIHTIWFSMLFLVLTLAYLRIYLTIRKRVHDGIASNEDGDPSRMRVVRPVIRFISHLTVATNRTGSANGGSSQSRDPGNGNNSVDDALVDNEPATKSSDAPYTPTIPGTPNPDNTTQLTGKTVTRALLLAGTMPPGPVLSSIEQTQDTGIGEPPDPADDKLTPLSSKPRRANQRPTAWSKIRPQSLLGHDIKKQQVGESPGSPRRVRSPFSTPVTPVNGRQMAMPNPVAKVLQKRAAATAMNLKMQKTTTNMLLVAALTAVITWFPNLVIGVVIPDVHHWLIEQEDWLKVLTCFMGWLFLFNFVTNPFVYSLMNSRFREDCNKSFPKCIKQCRKKMNDQNGK